MKLNKLLSEVTGKVSSAAVILLFAAGPFITTGCNKKDVSPPPTESERLSGSVQNDVSPNDQGTNNGFFWSLYREGGSASITYGSAGNFVNSYSNVNDVVGGKGWNPDRPAPSATMWAPLSGCYNFVWHL